MARYDVVDLIIRKRDRGELTPYEIGWLVAEYARGAVPDEQMAALAMAIVLNGMTRAETHELTAAMVASGERLDFSTLSRPTVDKHSTGGVGDKVTLPLMPLVASFGAAVPQLSGRGLGHTGGTLDKLESIPGWRADVGTDELLDLLETIGGVVCAASADLAPADRRLYALRDTTGTVESIPLIASSIMSKKIAEGTSALVLDVKFGSGAFMKSLEQARALADVLVELGRDAGVVTRALLTNMSVPLGRAVGNANEVREALEVLDGGGPPDVVELVTALAREMLDLAGIHDADVAAALADGRAMAVWRASVRAQGGDPDAALPTPRETHVVRADRDGVLVELDALAVGQAAWRLGAGRSAQGETVSHAAGVDIHVRPGEQVRAGEPLLTLGADEPERLERALEALRAGWRIGAAADAVAQPALIADRIV